MTFIIGSDEVGYGALVSDLVVCGVRAAPDWTFNGLKDSKRLLPKRRQELYKQLMEAYVYQRNFKFYIAKRSNTYIDQVGVYQALKEAHVEVFKMLHKEGDHIIVDGTLKFDGFDVDHLDIESMIKADGKVPHVMAAAIIAKTQRDAMMIELAKQYPQYGWEKNKGYGASDHLEALKKYGITPLHRMSYRPMKILKDK